MDLSVVDISRLQFVVTAMYHFLFVPLTIGLAVLIAIFETAYVITNNVAWKDITKFWGKLFAINFAMGIATGITMEFQFGTNWAYYSHYVGDIFGIPLALKGLMAFFLESTFIGLFFFGWDRLSKKKHLMVTWLMAIGANLSAFWILIANGWMQNPVGAIFNPETMRMEISSMYEVIFNPVAQAKFVHTISACYVTGAMFVMAISSYYLLKGRCYNMAKRSIAVASSFGLLVILATLVLGGESGYLTAEHQKMKLAAVEAHWETGKIPAGYTVIGIPDAQKKETKFKIEIPYVLGLIATRSTDTEIKGINELVLISKERVKKGIEEYRILEKIRNKTSKNIAVDIKYIRNNYHNIGYALLLKKYRDDIINATEEEISMAAQDTVPNVPALFYSLRIMIYLGLVMLILMIFSFYYFNIKQKYHKWLLRSVLFSLPLPWIAISFGWIVAEYGRQPWAIEGILPTMLGMSSVSFTQVLLSLSGFIIFYTILLIVNIFLMVKYIKIGPALTFTRK